MFGEITAVVKAGFAGNRNRCEFCVISTQKLDGSEEIKVSGDNDL